MNALFFREAPGVIRLDHLSRREFLKWTQKGLAGLFTLAVMDSLVGKERILAAAANSDFLEEAFFTEGEVPEKGRVLDNTLAVYDKPSFSAKLVNMYWRDLVLPINGVTIGDKEPAYNRVWYKVNNNEGYAHSGKMQPVALRYNKPVTKFEKGGLLAEVTVPYTDAVKDPTVRIKPNKFACRLYFSTVHWILDAITDKEGQQWYRIRDDKVKTQYYVNAEHVCPISRESLAPISPRVPAKEKRLEIRLGQQVVVAYEGGKPVFMARVASGGRFIDGDYTTPTGRYMTNRKRPSRHMASGDMAAPSSYDLPGVPWVSYLTLSGISFHGTYWHNDFGKPRSHGCINLSPSAARFIYRWTDPSVPYGEHTWSKDEGTQVDVVE